MDAKRVLVVYHWLPHYRIRLFRKLSRNFNFEFVADVKSNYDSLEVYSGKDVLHHKVKNHWIGPFLWQQGLINLNLNYSPSHIIFLADWKFLTVWYYLIARRGNGEYTIGWTHGLSARDSIFIKIIKRFYYKLFDEVWTYDEAATDRLKELNIFSRPIYNSIGDSLEIELDGKSIFRDIMFSGRITVSRAKNIIFFVTKNFVMSDALRNAGIRMEVVGDGAGIKILREFILNNELGTTVNLHGPVYSLDDLFRISKNCGMMVFPSDVGLAAITALQLGLKVLTHGNVESHKPEFEALLQAEALSKLRLEDYTTQELLQELNSGAALDEYKRKEVLRKWSLDNQVELIKEYLCLTD